MQFCKRYYYVYVITFVAACALALFVSERLSRYRAAASQDMPQPVIVIDPGHGGEDGGAVSCTGVPESRLNLEISLRLRDLCELFGLRTAMVRTEDVSIYSAEAQTVSEKKVSDLRNRVRLANETPGAVLVSIHQNTFPEEQYAGAQVFYADTAGSQELAEQLQAHFCSELDPSNHRASKPSKMVYLMEHIRCTGVLIECGFLSNRAEEAKLNSPAYQKQMAAVITASLSDFLSQSDGSTGS